MKIQRKAVAGRGKNPRGIMITCAGLAAYGIYLALRIPLTNLLGDSGICILAPALEIFFLASVFFSYGLSRTLTGLIRYRTKREQFKSARRIFRIAFRLALLLGIVTAVVVAVFSGAIADILVLETLSKRAVLVTAPTIVLIALISVFRGYFNGSGFGVLVAHSQYIEKISMAIAVLFCGELFYDYGLKVSALLQNEMAAYAYSAMGVMFGVMLSELLTLLHLLFVYVLYSNVRKGQLLQDFDRRLESNREILGMLLQGGLPVAIITLLCNAYLLIDQRFFYYCMNRLDMEAEKTILWGSYYGKTVTILGIAAVLVCFAIQENINRIMTAYEKEEYRMMRDRIGSAVKKLCVVSFPIAVNVALLAEILINGLYQGETKQAVFFIQAGAAAIILYGFAFLFGQLILRLHFLRDMFIAVLVSFVLHLAVVYLLMRQIMIGAVGILYGMLVFIGLLAVLSVFFAIRRLKYKQEWLVSVVFPALCACLSGLVVMLISRLLLDAAGEIVTILVSCLTGTLLYILLLMIFRVLQEGELSRMPFGNLWITLGRMIGVL